MAPVIWGLDLKEMQWGKFKSSYMFGNRDYHLRRTKFIVYQLALIFCVVSESLGTSALSDYIDQQALVKKLNPAAHVHNNDYVGVASYNIFAGVFVAFIFGAAFFFDLFWPERHETKAVRIAWKVCGVLAVFIHLASALAITIITATHQAYVTGVSKAEGSALAAQYKPSEHTTLSYKHNPRALAAVIFAWLGWVSIVPSCVLLFLSIDNTEKGPGPKSAHAAGREQANLYANTGRRSMADTVDTEKEREPEQPVREPEVARTAPIQTDGALDSPPGASEAAEKPSAPAEGR